MQEAGQRALAAAQAATDPIGGLQHGHGAAAARELDGEAVQRAELYTDRRESAWNEAGDLIVPRDEGLIDESHLRGELGELLTGEAPGRSGAEAITLFESLGLGVEDLAAGEVAVARARELGLGTTVDLGGLAGD